MIKLKKASAQIKWILKKTWVFEIIVWARRCSSRDLRNIKEESHYCAYSYSPVHDLIKDIASSNSIKVFFETGTYIGNTVYAVKDHFEEIYSVELSKDLAMLARARFHRYAHIHIINENSSTALKRFVDSLREPALFWLDAHYSGGITAKGRRQTPIREELNAILTHPLVRHHILVDDVKDFNGQNDYPTVEEVLSMVKELSDDNYEACVHGNVFLISPKKSQFDIMDNFSYQAQKRTTKDYV